MSWRDWRPENWHLVLAAAGTVAFLGMAWGHFEARVEAQEQAMAEFRQEQDTKLLLAAGMLSQQLDTISAEQRQTSERLDRLTLELGKRGMKK